LIYVDSSIALARLLSEARSPPEQVWRQQLVSSSARNLLALIDMLEMTRAVLARALTSYPAPVRTPDGLHLATAEYLYRQDNSLDLGSYDEDLNAAARALGIPLAEV
jgi:hypothetical protein